MEEVDMKSLENRFRKLKEDAIGSLTKEELEMILDAGKDGKK